jgi:hypothetical protein
VNAVVRLAAVMAVVVILIGVWMFCAAEFEHDDLPQGFTSPVLAMELARSNEYSMNQVGNSKKIASLRSRRNSVFCRNSRSGVTRIRTGDTMIFRHMRKPLAMRETRVGKRIYVRRVPIGTP